RWVRWDWLAERHRGSLLSGHDEQSDLGAMSEGSQQLRCGRKLAQQVSGTHGDAADDACTRKRLSTSATASASQLVWEGARRWRWQLERRALRSKHQSM